MLISDKCCICVCGWVYIIHTSTETYYILSSHALFYPLYPFLTLLCTDDIFVYMHVFQTAYLRLWIMPIEPRPKSIQPFQTFQRRPRTLPQKTSLRPKIYTSWGLVLKAFPRQRYGQMELLSYIAAPTTVQFMQRLALDPQITLNSSWHLVSFWIRGVPILWHVASPSLHFNQRNRQ